MGYVSPHMMREETEQKLVAFLVNWLGEHGPSTLDDLFAKVLREAPQGITGFSAMTLRAENEGVVEKVDGVYRLTKQGEGLYVFARGKMPKSARHWSFTPEQAAAIRNAYVDNTKGGA